MIEITEFKLINKSSLQAQVSIKIPKWGGFRIKRIKVFEKDDSRWIMLPSEEYEKDGKKKFYALNDFDTNEMSDAFRHSFFKVYDEYIAKIPQNSS
jgi:hypothetical protein